MGSNLSDLNAAWHEQLARLQSSNGSAAQRKEEIQRATAIMGISDQITKVAALQLTAAKLYAQHGDRVIAHLPQIGRAEPRKVGES